MIPFDRERGAPLWAKYAGKAAGDAPRPPAWRVPPGAVPPPPPAGALPGCPLPEDWESRLYMAIDFETTGLYAGQDRIVEAGAILFRFDREGALVEELSWSSLVNPGIPMPTSATAIHGITDLDVSRAPFFRDICDEFVSLAEGRVLVAHNASFDLGFLRCECSRAALSPPGEESVDTVELARLAFPSFFSYSLGKLAFRLEIETGSAHRALDDARTCMHIFARSARILAGTCP